MGDVEEYSYEDILMEALDRVKRGVQGSLEEIIEQIKQEIKSKARRQIATTAAFVENLLALPLHLKKVYFYLWESEGRTKEEIARDCKMRMSEVSAALRQLSQAGFVRERKAEDGTPTFYVPKVRRTPRAELEFSWKCFLGPPMPPIYHYHLLCDVNRVGPFQRVMKKVVREGDVVADLGAGTGILSLFAAEKARKVYAVEIDPFLIEAAKNMISKYPVANKIEFIEADARTVELDEKVDVVICEMLDTALIAEHQVPVMNHAVESLIKPGGTIIPLGAITYIELVTSDYDFYGYKLPIPFHEEYGARKVRDVLSEKVPLHHIWFNEINPIVVDKEVTIETSKEGVVNSFRLTTYVYMDESVIVRPSTWLNPPLVFPLFKSGEGISVRRGERLSLYISYEMGSGLDYVSYALL